MHPQLSAPGYEPRGDATNRQSPLKHLLVPLVFISTSILTQMHCPIQGDWVLIREMDPNRSDIAHAVSQEALDSDSEPDDDPILGDSISVDSQHDVRVRQAEPMEPNPFAAQHRTVNMHGLTLPEWEVDEAVT